MHKRFLIGTIILIIGFVSPAFIPIVLSSPIPEAWKAVISGFLALGIPELFMFIAVAIMGKEGMVHLKQKLGHFLIKYGPSDEVSPIRYKIGLFFFTLPLLIGFFLPYIQSKFEYLSRYCLTIAITGDAMLFVSLFILGGNFWDKIRSLFIREARVTFPQKN